MTSLQFWKDTDPSYNLSNNADKKGIPQIKVLYYTQPLNDFRIDSTWTTG